MERRSRRCILGLAGTTLATAVTGCVSQTTDEPDSEELQTTARDLTPLELSGTAETTGEGGENLTVTSHGAYENPDGEVVMKSVVEATGGPSENWVHWSYELFDDGGSVVVGNHQEFGGIDDGDTVTDYYNLDDQDTDLVRYEVVVKSEHWDTDA